jgi:DNA modification methylase
MKRADREKHVRRVSRPRVKRPHGESIPKETKSRALTIATDFRRSVGARAIEFVRLNDIRPNSRNARRHTPHQIERLAASIRAFTFIGALVIDEANCLLAGHARWKALRLLGYEVVPCIRAGNLTPEAKQAFAIADNQLALLATWDDEILKDTLDDLSTKDLAFDIETTGFDAPDIDRILGPEPDPRGRGVDDDGFSTRRDDDVPELRHNELPVSEPGDIWVTKHHRILCADALDPQSYRPLLLGTSAVVQVVTDPPYNVNNEGHVSRKSFREFAMAHGELSAQGFTDFLAQFMRLASAVSVDGAILHVCMDWRHMGELLSAAEQACLSLKNLCVWAKPSAGMGSFYRSQHELVAVLKVGSGPHINNFGLGARGRYRTNVWHYPAVRGARTGVSDPDGGHPTVKPVSMITDAIRDCSRRGDIILDPFGGSGTTLIAAERVGRKARLIEIDPQYTDLIVRRFQAVTGKTVTLEGDGRTFHQLAAARRGLTLINAESPR